MCRVLPGIRLINQDPWECLISFIFSSNNNIKRITKGLNLLRASYGKYACTIRLEAGTGTGGLRGEVAATTMTNLDDKVVIETSLDNVIHLYSFPSVEALSSIPEEAFRSMGYRA